VELVLQSAKEGLHQSYCSCLHQGKFYLKLMKQSEEWVSIYKGS